jgi:NAD(P)-dependent dehydrogenase (short-subunit alcohol dehydrogenase family)
MEKTTRRQVMTASTIAAAAAAAGSTLAQPAAQPRGGKQDPRTKYPKPPFPAQSQPWPGLAGKMDPPPDHGEAINYLPAEEPDAREVIGLIRAAGQKAVALPGDLRDAAFCRRLVDDAVGRLGGLDILVSNAGRQQSISSIAEVSDEEFDWTMKTNVYAPFWIIKAALPHMQPGSAIIATTSEQAYDPSPDLYAYAQTKAATMNFVKSLAKQLGSKGIRINGVAPGPIWTPLQISGGASEGKVVTFGATAPLGRPGQPAELAGIYVRLAEDDGSYTTGNIYGAGGGQGQP